MSVLVVWGIIGCRGGGRIEKRTDGGSVSSRASQTDRSAYGPEFNDLVERGSADFGGLPPDHPLREKWARPILSAVISPDGKTVALHDNSGVYLTDGSGAHIRKVDITLLENLANDQVTVFFVFRPDGRRVAVLTRLSYGEPMGEFIERLWTVDAAGGLARQLSEWSDWFRWPGPIVGNRRIEGWTPDGKSVIVMGTIYTGDMPAEMRPSGTKRVAIRDKPAD